MSARAKGISVVSLLLVAALAALLLVNGRSKAQRDAVADDAYRTTGLSIDNGVATAGLSDTQTTDETWVITWYHTPSGGSESIYSEVESSKTNGWQPPAASATLETSAFSSGDTLRARFRTYDTGGSNTFDYSRSVQIP